MCRAVQDALVFSRWFQYCSEVLNDDWTGRRRFAEGCGVLLQQRGAAGPGLSAPGCRQADRQDTDRVVKPGLRSAGLC